MTPFTHQSSLICINDEFAIEVGFVPKDQIFLLSSQSRFLAFFKIGFFVPKMKYLRPVQLYNELLKLNTTGPLLGFSVGKRHLGLAISDPTKRDAYPFRTLVKNETNFDSVVSDLQCLISKHSIAGFVIGVPYSSPRGSPSELFLGDLIEYEKFEDMKFAVWDDKCTTKRRFQTLRERVPSKLATRPLCSTTLMDYYAAFEILKDYLRFVNKYDEEETKEEIE